MRGKKERLARIANETDINALEAMRDDLHSLADIAAVDDLDRDWRDYCDCEDACTRRIKELSKMKNVDNSLTIQPLPRPTNDLPNSASDLPTASRLPTNCPQLPSINPNGRRQKVVCLRQKQ